MNMLRSIEKCISGISSICTYLPQWEHSCPQYYLADCLEFEFEVDLQSVLVVWTGVPFQAWAVVAVFLLKEWQ